MTDTQTLRLARLVNIAALFALIGVLAGSLHLQFGVGEQPCPLCLIQRSGMIGLAIGPILNLIRGMRPSHYALSILAALVGSAGSIRQILLHINDPMGTGYGPAVMGYHLYTWALITFVVGITGIAILLLWNRPFEIQDDGLMSDVRPMRILGLTAMIWVALDLLVIAFSVLPECGLGMCPDNPDNVNGLGDIGGWVLMLAMGVMSLVLALVVDRRMSGRRPSHF